MVNIQCKLEKDLQVRLIGGHSGERGRQTGHRELARAADWCAWHKQSGDHVLPP